MNILRLKFVVTAVGTFILLAATMVGGSSMIVAPAAAATRPNIVIIMTDDQRLDDMRVLSKTRALFAPGTTFSNFHVTLPTCCPSRATFLTGQYAHNHTVYSNSPPSGGYEKLDHSNTLPLWLQAAGYYTAHIGKYLNGYPAFPNEVPPGWHDWQGLTGGAKYYNYDIVDNGVSVHYGADPADYQTDVLSRRSLQTIRELVNHQPFFLSIAPKAPHDEEHLTKAGILPNPTPAPRHVGTLADEPLPRPPSFNEADVSDKPASIRKLTLLSQSAIEHIAGRYRSRLEALLSVDDLVQAVFQELNLQGLLGNTMVIFTSDNGWFQGEHRIRRDKGRFYTEATQVPLMIRGGGFPRNKTVSQVASNIDLAPTIIAAAVATSGLTMDGRPLLRLALDPTVDTSRTIMLDALSAKGVMNRQFYYVTHNTGEVELYDLRTGNANYDPFQLQSRHAASAYASIRTSLKNKLDKLRNCSGSGCIVQ
jgi:arylsulfatase A-like enzyme